MFARLIDLLFGCAHERTTFPQSPRPLRGVAGPMHVTCLDCGRELGYDWQKMRVAPAMQAARPAGERGGVEDELSRV